MEREEVEKERNDHNDTDDSDEPASHWRMRRTEASDDDVDSEEEEVDDVSSDRRVGTRFENELESLGGAPDDTEEDAVADVAVFEEEEREAAFMVPTCGSFYLHDDRFASSYSQCWNVYGGRALKGVKDESKWAHDKFQEMSMKNVPQRKNFNVWRTGNGADRVHWKGQGRGNGVFLARTDGVRYRANMSGRDKNAPMRNNGSELPRQTGHNSARVLLNSRMVGSDSYGSKKQYFASNGNSVEQMNHYVSSDPFREPYFDRFRHWTGQYTWPMYMAQYSQMAQVQPYFQQFGLHSGNGFPDLLEAISPSGTIRSCGTHFWPGMQFGNRRSGGFYDHSIDNGSSKHISQLGIGSEDNAIPCNGLGSNYTDKDGKSHAATGKANRKSGQQKIKPQRNSKMY